MVYDLLSQIVVGYINRNPMTVRGQSLLYSFCNIVEPFTNPSGMVSFITGPPGVGKTAFIRRILSLLGLPVIQHSVYKGTVFAEKQLLYLMRNLPTQMTYKAFCRQFGQYAATLLNSEEDLAHFKGNKGKDDFEKALRRILTKNFLGLFVIDEIQNLLRGKASRDEIVRFVQNSRDEIGIPIILVGSNKALDILNISDAFKGRFTEGGYHKMDRFLLKTSADNDEWKRLCTEIWQYQWVQKPVPMDDYLVKNLYERSQGIFRILLTLFIVAQRTAIKEKTEIVNSETIDYVYENCLQPIHPIIARLASNPQYMYEENIEEVDKDLMANQEIRILEERSKTLANSNAFI